MDTIQLRDIYLKLENHSATKDEKQQFKYECLSSCMRKEWLYAQIMQLDRECTEEEITEFDNMLSNLD